MTRPWLIWPLFGLCLLVACAAMGFVSWTALRLDRSEAEARRLAPLEENSRYALWRMEYALAPLLALENGRPYFLYRSFCPAERAYTRMYSALVPNEILTPSPLLTLEVPQIRLHFQVGPEGEFTSPQVPTGNMRDLAEMGLVAPEKLESAAARLKELQQRVTAEALCKALPPDLPAETLPASRFRHNTLQGVFNQRAQSAQQAQIGRNEQQSRQELYVENQALVNANNDANPLQSGPVKEGLLKAVWIGETLLLARRVEANGQAYLQGCWLDWPRIRRELLESTRDLLPEAQLEPVSGGAAVRSFSPLAAPDARQLVALPVRLVPGRVPADAPEGLSPLQASLVLAWGAVLLAALVLGLVLWQAVQLSERRGAFVSAVTHELRTPLTTFQLYTELLAQGPPVAPEKQRQYLATLRREADRLSHLVENVLAYARLERNRAGGRREDVALGGLIERTRARLADRAAQAGMQFEVVLPPEAAALEVHTDQAAVEQILFNLVDNACKYAACAADKSIRLEAAVGERGGLLRVRDRGPGIRESKRLFQPFSKSAQQAARSAPGVGLGLALSRRLARQMGGELRWDEGVKDGACFVLTLPAAKSGASNA